MKKTAKKKNRRLTKLDDCTISIAQTLKGENYQHPVKRKEQYRRRKTESSMNGVEPAEVTL